MKKLILIIVAMFGLISCENPSMEDGLANLEASLAQLEAALANIDVDQMVADLTTMQSQVETIESQIEEYEIDLIEYIDQVNSLLADLAELQTTLDNASTEQIAIWEAQIQDILADLAVAQEIIDSAATKEQIGVLLEDLEATQAMIDQLVLIADYDHDGVVNGLDQCPDTELNVTVNEQGCSVEQVAAQTGTASSTTTSTTTG